jgi:hypothetical protein
MPPDHDAEPDPKAAQGSEDPASDGTDDSKAVLLGHAGHGLVVECKELSVDDRSRRQQAGQDRERRRAVSIPCSCS